MALSIKSQPLNTSIGDIACSTLYTLSPHTGSVTAAFFLFLRIVQPRAFALAAYLSYECTFPYLYMAGFFREASLYPYLHTINF